MNIDDEYYDPFPKTGLIRQYKNAILKQLTKFLRKYPDVPKQDALHKFIELAAEAEKRFKPELGYSFWTYCRPYIKGAHRELVTKEREYQKHIVHLDPGLAEAINARAATGRAFDPHGEMPRPIFPWWIDGSESAPLNTPGPCEWLGGGVDPRYLVWLYGTPEDRGCHITEEMEADLLAILASPADFITGAMMAVIAHHDRRRREAEQEAENQRHGCYDWVFLDVRESQPVPTLSEASVLIPRAPDPKLLQSAADKLRPSLTVIEAAVLVWMIRRDNRTLTQMAADVGISKGYASKVQAKLWGRLRGLLGNTS